MRKSRSLGDKGPVCSNNPLAVVIDSGGICRLEVRMLRHRSDIDTVLFAGTQQVLILQASLLPAPLAKAIRAQRLSADVSLEG